MLAWHKRSYTRDPICPHCGKEYQDAWELRLDEDDVETLECGTCNEEFEVERVVTVEYSTRPVGHKYFGYDE